MSSTPEDKTVSEGLEGDKQAVIYARWDSDPVTSFEVDTQEDIPGNLEAFVRLNRLGRFTEARAFFEKTLHAHVEQFPVFIEYADLLLEQGDFGLLSRFLRSSPTKLFSAEENMLIELLQALSNIYVDAAWESAWTLSQRAWNFLDQQSLEKDELPSDIQIHITETYLAITVLGFQRFHPIVELSEPQNFPWIVPGVTMIAKYAPYISWHHRLQAHGLQWEAYRILQLLLPLLNLDEVSGVAQPRMLSNIISSVESVKSDESQLLTVLTIANGIIRYALAFFSGSTEENKRELLEFVYAYYELAATVVGTLFGPDPASTQGRLVIQWMLAKEQIKALEHHPKLDSDKTLTLLSELSNASRAHGDIKLYTELLPAISWMEEDGSHNFWSGPQWDITRLAAPLIPLIVLPLDISRNRLKSILRKYSSDWAIKPAAEAPWNLILVPALEHERCALLENLIKIVSDSSALTSETPPALSLAAKVISQNLDGYPPIIGDLNGTFYKAASAGVSKIPTSAAPTYKSQICEILSERDSEGKTLLDYAIENNHEVTITSILDLVPDLRVTRKSLHLVTEYTNMSYLLRIAKRQPEQIDASLVKKLIQCGRADISRSLIEISQAGAFKSDEWEQLLPLAVRKRQPSVVEILVTKFPTSAFRVDENGHYPLWYNNPTAAEEGTQDSKYPGHSMNADREIQQKIRDMIVPLIIAQMPISEAKKALGDDAKELCLDLMSYRNSPESFSKFIISIDTSMEKSSMATTFESVLQYVHIPNPDPDDKLLSMEAIAQNMLYWKSSSRNDRIGQIFRWLSQEKGVRKVFQVVLEDSYIFPCNEDEIVNAIGRFDVERLNWCQHDISIDCIMNAAPNVKELVLYSSKWISICQWTSEEGAVMLPKLEILHIVISDLVLTKALADKYLQRAEERMDSLLKSSSRVLRLYVRLESGIREIFATDTAKSSHFNDASSDFLKH